MLVTSIFSFSHCFQKASFLKSGLCGKELIWQDKGLTHSLTVTPFDAPG